jgi:hypothetical protein
MTLSSRRTTEYGAVSMTHGVRLPVWANTLGLVGHPTTPTCKSDTYGSSP